MPGVRARVAEDVRVNWVPGILGMWVCWWYIDYQVTVFTRMYIYAVGGLHMHMSYIARGNTDSTSWQSYPSTECNYFDWAPTVRLLVPAFWHVLFQRMETQRSELRPFFAESPATILPICEAFRRKRCRIADWSIYSLEFISRGKLPPHM